MVFLPAPEPSDNVLCARQVLPLHEGVVLGQGDSDIKGVVWLRAGPAQPGTALGDICDLDVLGLCCRAESEGAMNEEGKVSRKKCLSSIESSLHVQARLVLGSNATAGEALFSIAQMIHQVVYLSLIIRCILANQSLIFFLQDSQSLKFPALSHQL